MDNFGLFSIVIKLGNVLKLRLHDINWIQIRVHIIRIKKWVSIFRTRRFGNVFLGFVS